MSDALVVKRPRGEALMAALLRALWFVVLPLLLTSLVLRYLLPAPVRAPEGVLRELSTWADQYEVVVAVALFLLFSALLRYWRALLPSAAQWSDEAAAASERSAKSSMAGVALLGAAVVAALAFRASLFQSYRVMSGSMLPTLQPNDLLLSTQYAYGARAPWGAMGPRSAPRRGDIVVFRRPPIRPDVPEELVKRVIGLPGDSVTTVRGFAFINDWRVPTCNVGPYVFVSGDGMLDAILRVEFLEDRAYLTAFGPTQPELEEPYKVKAGEVFVLGDNRNNSSDSRAWNAGRGGGLRFDELRGRVDRILLGARRNGAYDVARFLEPLGLELRSEGIDESELRAGIKRCLKERPKETRPPKPGAAAGTAAPAPKASP